MARRLRPGQAKGSRGRPSRPGAQVWTLAVLALTFILLSACASPLATPTPAPSPTEELARAYFLALSRGDRAVAGALIQVDPWCTTPALSAEFEKQLALLTSTQTRNVSIVEEDVLGWVAYPPGTTAASIHVEVRGTADPGWRTARLFVAVVDGRICDTNTRVE